MKFTQQQKDELIYKLQQHFEQELDIDLGQFQADILLDFINKEIGAYHYNQGIYDAQTLLAQRLEFISEEMVQLEKPID